MNHRIMTLTAVFLSILIAGCSFNGGSKTPQETTAQKQTDTIQATAKPQQANAAKEEATEQSTIAQEETNSADYILPFSSERPLTEDDIKGMQLSMLALARNEIYARHGYIFKMKEFKDYFEARSWYKPNHTFTESSLSDIEKKNAKFIKQKEDGRKTAVKVIKRNSEKEDLNGDGVQETISLNCKEGANEYTLHINNASYKGEGENFSGYFGIIDIDFNDNIKEIAISQYGPSDDYITYFFHYDGKNIIFMGEVQGLFDENMKIDGSGILVGKDRGHILHTWYHDSFFKLTGSHQLQSIPKDLYDMNCEVTVKQSFTLQKSPTDSTPAVNLKPGEKAVILASDDKEWCLVKNSKGEKGWFGVTNFYQVKGSGLNAPDIFEGLCYAD